MELHPKERDILAALAATDGPARPEELEGVDPTTARRMGYWLSQKGLVTLEELTLEEARITEEGRLTFSNGLIERRLLTIVTESTPLEDLFRTEGLSREQVKIGLGWLRKRKWVTIGRDEDVTVLTRTDEGKNAADGTLPEEEILAKLATGPIAVTDKERKLLETLLHRSMASISERKKIVLAITDEGRKVLEASDDEGPVSLLTPVMLETGSWRNVSFRKYDVTLPVPPTRPGRKHPLLVLIDRVRRIFLDMGFQEARGPFVESSFWCFDALFQPQDHPARELADTFYMKEPAEAVLPKKIVPKVRSAHENGTAGSSGWGYKWSEDVSRRPVLRTHTTAVSARRLSELKPPAKVFCVDRAFRNETLDYKHLMEFHQVEGIVVSEDVTFNHLLGYLKEFYQRLGFDKVRFRPAYFPYTEMSVEPEVWMPSRKSWIELGGAGMFRPEVTEPLGIECPVLAWGLGLERPAMLALEMDDMRTFYRNDADWLADAPGVF